MTQVSVKGESTADLPGSSILVMLWPEMANAIAVKQGQIKEKLPEGFLKMGSVRCEGCGTAPGRPSGAGGGP